MTNKTLADVSEALRADEVERANSLVEPLLTNMTEAIEVTQIYESVFKDVFLDYFRNGLAEDDNFLTLKWLELAGTPYSEVGVVNDDGEELFRVPGLLCSAEFDGISVADINFKELSDTYELKAGSPIGGAEQFLRKSLSGLDRLLTSEQTEHRDKWEAIFARYAPELSDEVKEETPLLELNYD